MWEVMLKKSDPAPRLGPPVSPESVDLVADDDGPRAGRPRRELPRTARPHRRPAVHAGPPGRHAVAPATRPTRTSAPPAPKQSRQALPPRGARRAGAGRGRRARGASTWAERRSARRRQPTPPGVELHTGNREELFNRESLLGWSPVGGPAWTIEEDDEKTAVMTGKGGIRRPFACGEALPRACSGIDLHEADAAEVVVAAADGPTARPRSSGRYASTRRPVRRSACATASAGRVPAARRSGPVPTAEELDSRTVARTGRCGTSGSAASSGAWYRGATRSARSTTTGR